MKLLKREQMHPYQHRTVDFILNNKNCALWLDMGLGKTVSTATAIADLQKDFRTCRTLVIAPKRVALTTWPLELRNWEHLMDLQYSVITGSAKERTAAILRRVDVHIVSRDNVAWLVQMCGRQWPWDMVVIDESSSFKSQSSNRWKALKKVLRLLCRVVELTATPAPQGLIDLWPQFYLLDRGARLGATEKAFTDRWFFVDREKRIKVPRDFAKEQIYSVISDITVHMNAEDYLKMPDLIINKIEVDLAPEVMTRYRKFEKEMVMEMSEYNLDIEIEASNAAVLAGKLLQMSNGAIYTDNARNYQVIHDEKIEALAEIIESHYGYPILVAYNFQSDLERLKKAFPQAVVMDDDPDTQVRWNNGQIEILLTHPASSGHGLNLQKGSNVIVWFGLNWSLELYLQLKGRLYRQGQLKNNVVIHHIVSRNTVDERVFSVLGKKDATQKDLLNAVKIIA